MWRRVGHHRVIGKLGERVAERGQLPVKYRKDTRFGWVKNHVVDANVAVDDRDFVTRRDVGGQPFDEPVHVRVATRFGVVEILGRRATDQAFTKSPGRSQSPRPTAE